ncbi:1663_t:CDS:1 [Cetraspora pellucida]|uniref:1663_t:CDS:1 n=1 Tax=Cetraspora pellucida TaxID=1433469 RepID=A0ACA9NRI8_9GLOM|nr:1663_t:CDS:1 [Cetraspora pellucida]
MATREIQYLNFFTGEIFDSYKINCFKYFNLSKINEDANKIITYNENLEKLRDEKKNEKVNVYFVTTKVKRRISNSKEFKFETYTAAGRQDRSKILQTHHYFNDDLKALWSLLNSVSQEKEFKGKCINIITDHELFSYKSKYELYRLFDSKLKNNNDILDKNDDFDLNMNEEGNIIFNKYGGIIKDNGKDVSDLDDIEYYNIINEIKTNLLKNDIIIDAEILLCDIVDVETNLRNLKRKIRKNNNY